MSNSFRLNGYFSFAACGWLRRGEEEKKKREVEARFDLLKTIDFNLVLDFGVKSTEAFNGHSQYIANDCLNINLTLENHQVHTEKRTAKTQKQVFDRSEF